MESLDGGPRDWAQMLPLGKKKTHLVTRWLVPEDAVEGVDYDLDYLTHVWIQTNAQDVHWSPSARLVLSLPVISRVHIQTLKKMCASS